MKEFPEGTALRKGQSLHFHARRGTTIAAARGTLRVCPAPAWIGEQMMQEQFVLAEGEAHIMPQSSWIAVHADAEAEIICSTQTGSILALLSSLLALLRSSLRMQSGAYARKDL